ncbi:acyl-CoA dehydrogenase family protein [Rhodococcus opacus]|uniref:acyl-CoA dehydrogenase family protein n=1 Tax=Rhodococcus opacus TaxID=37919 RepID=UPI002949A4F9|nr:acyl-CoA dehydrogenase family protein [Rhodococcus opacus]MDV6247483.1 acyl-CoA dehydrogenase family protein [Rhodococcus opacus]
MTAPNPVIPDLLYSELEQELRNGVVDVMSSKAKWSDILARTESDNTVDTDLWRTLVQEVGLAGLPVSEEAGGAGASWREVAVVLEELGKAAAPVPYLGSAVTGTALLMALQSSELLAKTATGETAVSLAVPVDVCPWAPTSNEALTVVTADEQGRLTGTILSVSDALGADILLVPVGETVYAVEAGHASIVPVTSLDMTRQLADITFDSADAEVIATGTSVGTAIASALTISAAMLASEQLGLAEKCLAMTVEYLKERRQFGRVLGSYQALKHRLADLWVEVTQARAVARYAAGCAANDSPDLPVASVLAHSLCSTVALNAAQECIQLHGGIGFTWEHPAHLYLKRAKASMLMFGGPDAHRARLGELVDITIGKEVTS